MSASTGCRTEGLSGTWRSRRRGRSPGRSRRGRGGAVPPDSPAPGPGGRGGEPIGLVESSVAVCEVVAPVSGVVVDVNPAVEGSPETITTDPSEGGWLLAIRPSAPEEVGGLLG